MFSRIGGVALALTLTACGNLPFSPVGAQGAAPAASTPAAVEAPRVTSKEAYARLQQGEAMVIVDVRSESAYAAGHIEGAINIPWGSLKDRYSELPKDKTILLYCTCPNEQSSAGAARDLAGYGYDKLLVLLVGLADWTAQGYPVSGGQ